MKIDDGVRAVQEAIAWFAMTIDKHCKKLSRLQTWNSRPKNKRRIQRRDRINACVLENRKNRIWVNLNTEIEEKEKNEFYSDLDSLRIMDNQLN